MNLGLSVSLLEFCVISWSYQSLGYIYGKTIEEQRGCGQLVNQNQRGRRNRNERERNRVDYFIDLCNVMTNTNSAITTSQPERPNERYNNLYVSGEENWETKSGTEPP